MNVLSKQNVRYSWMKYLYLGVFFIPLIWNPWGGNEPHETAKESWFLLFLAIFFLGLIFQVFRSSLCKVRLSRPLVFLTAVWLLSFGISTFLSIAPMESFWGSYHRLQGAFNAVLYAVHFFICLSLFREEKYQRAFFIVTLCVGVLLSFYSILQALDLDPFVSGDKGIFSGRSMATMGSPIFLGQFLIFPWSIAFVSFLRKKKWPLHLALLTLFSWGLYFTLNRASMIGLFCILAMGFLSRIRWTKIKITIVGLCFFFLIGGVFAFLKTSSDASKFSSLRSVGSRSVLWGAALPLIPKYFFFGSGPETVYQTIQTTLSPNLYRYERMLDVPDRVHNVLLETWLTRGVFGVLIGMGTLLWIAWIVRRRGLKNIYIEASFYSLLAYVISMQFGFSVVTHAVFFVAMAAIFFQITPFKTYRINFRPAYQFSLFFLCILIAGFFGKQAYQFTKAELLVGKGLNAFFYQDPAAIEHFNAAWRSIPYFRELPYMAFFFFEPQGKQNPELIPYLERAANQIEVVSRNSFYTHLVTAQLALTKENNETAWKEFDKFSRLAPNWPGTWYKWGKAALAAGDIQTAREKFEKFLTFVPKFSPQEKEKERIFQVSNPAPFEVELLLMSLAVDPF